MPNFASSFLFVTYEYFNKVPLNHFICLFKVYNKDSSFLKTQFCVSNNPDKRFI